MFCVVLAFKVQPHYIWWQCRATVID